jgi:O-antigen/teichoic acid export membrane protein
MGALVRNHLYNFITTTLRFLSNVALFIIIAKQLRVEEFGRFTFAISFTGIFLGLVDYGFRLQLTRDIAVAPHHARTLINDAMIGKFILSLFSTAALIFIAKVLAYPFQTMLIIYILWAGTLFYSFGVFFNTVFRGFNQFQKEAYPTVVLNILQFVLVITLLILGLTTTAIAVAYTVSRLIYLWISYSMVVKQLGNLKFSLHIKKGMAVLKECLPFGIHAILSILYLQLDTVFLSHYKGNIEVAFYQSAMRILLGTMIISEVISSSYFPLLAAKIKSDRGIFLSLAWKLNKYLLITGGLIAVPLYVYSGQIIEFLYGAKYSSADSILRWLAIVIFIRFLLSSFSTFMTVADNQTKRTIGVAV